MCAKVLAPVIWPYEEIRNHWDRITLRSWTRRDADRVLYQEDALGAILDAERILDGLPAEDVPTEDIPRKTPVVEPEVIGGTKVAAQPH